MATAISEDRNEEVGAAVDDSWVLAEVGHVRNRTQDKDEIIRVHAMSDGRAGRIERLLREVFRGKGSPGTRLHVFARMMKSVYSQIFPPKF